MTTAFAKAFVKKADKVFNQAKKHKHRTGTSFGPVPVPDGNFTAVVTIDTSVPTKGKMEGIPIVRVKGLIDQGPYEGLEPSQSYFCEGKPVPSDPDEFPTAEMQLLGLLGHLLPDIQIDEISQVPQAIELVNERGPRCEIGIRNTADKNDTEKKYQNIYFNKLLKAQTFEANSSSQNDTVTETTASDESSNLDEPEVSDYVPAKGDMVTVEGEDTEYEVAQVSQARKTANLTDSEGNRKNGISWEDLTLV